MVHAISIFPIACVKPFADSLSAIKHHSDARCFFDKGCPGKLGPGGIGE